MLILKVNSHELCKKLTYSCKEAAEALSLSEPTVARLCREGRLPRVKGIRHILIPVSFLEEWVKNNTVYTSSCVEGPMGESSWVNASRRKRYTNGPTAQSGMQITQKQAVKELDVLLGQPVKERL